MEKSGFVYIWFDRKHKRYYVGCHWGFEYDSYVCSSAWMMQAYKIRPHDFKRRILVRNINTRKKMFLEEQRFFSMIKPEELRIRYYNLNIKNNAIWSTYDENVKTISKKISIKTKEAMARPEVKAKYLEGLNTRDNKSSDPEVIEKRRASMQATMAKKFPKENRKKRPKFGSIEYRSNMANKTAALWEREGYREEIGSKISNSLAASREFRSNTMKSLKWWTNGVENVRRKESPGQEWILGRAIKAK
jgi:hypothetical protein